MCRKWVIVGLTLALLFASFAMPVAAYRGGVTYSWDCGLQVRVHCENVDIWTTGIPYDIFARLTLIDTGTVEEILDLTFVLIFVTESVDTGYYYTTSPWSTPGESIDFVGRFNITPAQVNHAEWDIYEAGYYYQLNQTVLLDGSQVNLYMDPKGPFHASVSTISFIVLWPWPPIILMTCIYWFGWWGLRKFNKRYDEIKRWEKSQLADQESG